MQLSLTVLLTLAGAALASAAEFSSSSWDDGCLRAVFPGPSSSSKSELLEVILAADNERVIDAFIACPTQMVAIYFEKLSESSEDFIESVKASSRIEEFYSSLKDAPNFASTEVPSTSDLINVMSYVHNVPEEYYLAALMESEEFYRQALLLKIIKTDDQRSKETLIDLLNEQIAICTADTSMVEFSAQMVKYYAAVIAFVNGEEEIDFSGLDQFARLGLSIYASVFERYDMVENLLEGHIIHSIALQSLKLACSFKYFKDGERVLAIYKNHLSEEDKENFDAIFGRL